MTQININPTSMFGIYIKNKVKSGDTDIIIAVRKINNHGFANPSIDDTQHIHVVTLTSPYTVDKCVIPNYFASPIKNYLEKAEKLGIHLFKDDINEVRKSILRRHIAAFMNTHGYHKFMTMHQIICDSCESYLPIDSKAYRIKNIDFYCEKADGTVMKYNNGSIDICDECYKQMDSKQFKEIIELLGEGKFIKIKDKSIELIKKQTGVYNQYDIDDDEEILDEIKEIKDKEETQEDNKFIIESYDDVVITL